MLTRTYGLRCDLCGRASTAGPGFPSVKEARAHARRYGWKYINWQGEAHRDICAKCGKVV